MLFTILQGGSLVDILVELILIMPVILFALSLHETAHGYAAYKCGDMTAYHMGRLTLNPMRHLDPVGFLCMLVFGFGWAKPVPINTRNFQNPKRGMAISAAAGPLSNLLLGVISAALYGFFMALQAYLFYQTGGTGFAVTAVGWTAVVFELSALMNLVFAVFNLLPVPPFDGSRIAFVFLPQRLYFKIMRYERQIMLGLLLGLLLLSRIFSFSPFSWIASALTDLISTPVANGLWSLLARGLV